MPKLKKIKAGKIKRHKLRKKLGVKHGFGKPWSAKSVAFRVEFCWCDEDGEETNEQVHWVECRKFEGQEYQFLRTFFSKMDWDEKETLFSKYVCFYVADFLVRQRQMAEGRWQKFFKDQGYSSSAIPNLDNFSWHPSFDETLVFGRACETASVSARDFPSALCPLPSALMLNQAFIFPHAKKGSEAIRVPLYQIKWTENLAENCKFDERSQIVLKNAIWHNY